MEWMVRTDPSHLNLVELLLMAKIRRSPVEVGSLSHYLQGFSIIRVAGSSCARPGPGKEVWHGPMQVLTHLLTGMILQFLNPNQIPTSGRPFARHSGSKKECASRLLMKAHHAF